jgi:hypothetical protein
MSNILIGSSNVVRFYKASSFSDVRQYTMVRCTEESSFKATMEDIEDKSVLRCSSLNCLSFIGMDFDFKTSAIALDLFKWITLSRCLDTRIRRESDRFTTLLTKTHVLNVIGVVDKHIWLGVRTSRQLGHVEVGISNEIVSLV